MTLKKQEGKEKKIESNRILFVPPNLIKKEDLKGCFNATLKVKKKK